jgi:hypothetical protein
MISPSDVSKLSAVKQMLLEQRLQGGAFGAEKLAPPRPAPAQKAGATETPRPAVVAIQTGGSKRPLFYTHIHAEGGAFYCFDLAQVLGPEQPLYVLEPFRSAELRAMPSFEAMAAAYVASMRVVQPEGPYQLVGFCGGGLIAFEMAQQLQAEGQTVDLLVMIEPRAGPDLFRMLRPRLLCGLVDRVGALLRFRPGQRADAFLALLHLYQVLHIRGLHPAHYQQLHAKGKLNLPLIPSAAQLHKNWLGIFTWLTSQYRPRPYPGKLIYLWSREEPSNRRSGKCGRVTKAKAVEIHRIPGNQTTCRTEHLHDLAGQIRACLEGVPANG